jgi:hypothetical protein
MIHCKNSTPHTKHYKLTQTMVSCGTLEVSMHLKRLSRGGNGGDTRNKNLHLQAVGTHLALTFISRRAQS